ncbi:MAG: ABC transporter permease [Chloroflexia bacterium]|nr:ABC transporter permease [Chloroflexia bacterium]
MDKRRPPLFWAGWGVLGVLAAAAVFAPLLAPYDPRLPTATPLTLPTRAHPLGTNDIGQDLLSQLLYAARTSLIVAVSVAMISTGLSWLVGLAAGMVRWLEAPLMALSDLLLALPNIPLYLLVVTLVGPSRRNLILVLALLSWPAFARVVRSVVLQTRSASYIEATRALGATDAHIVRRHLLPATLDVLPTKLTLTVRFAIFAEATLAFLGLGDSASVSWGTMLSYAFNEPLLFNRAVWPWLILPPTAAIMALILATTWISSGFERLPEPSRRRLHPSPGIDAPQRELVGGGK